MTSEEKRIDNWYLDLYNSKIMTIEFERRDILNQTVSREVLQPGTKKTLQPQSFMKPSVSLEVLSDSQVKIVKSFAGETIEEVELEKDSINKSPKTYSYFNRFKVSWRKDS